MSEYIETVSTEDANAVIDNKLRKVFDGRIVRKENQGRGKCSRLCP